MKTMNYKKWLIVVIGLLAMESQSAQAEDTKIYPGAYCRQVGGAGGLSTDGPFVLNVSNETVVVSCPVLRDAVLDSQGWLGLRIFARDESDVAAVECSAYSRQSDGETVFLGSASTEIEGTTPGIVLWEQLTVEGGEVSSSVPRGNYGIVCSLPPSPPGGRGTGIGGYQVIEE